VCHHEPPEVTWLLPELEDGVDPELRPELELELPELEPLEPELELDPLEVDPELVEPDEVDAVELDPELAELEPLVVAALAVCVDPGRTRANAPAAATLATVTAVVAVLTLPRPRSLAAIAWRTPSPFVLLMSFSLHARPRRSLDVTSRSPLSHGQDQG